MEGTPTAAVLARDRAMILWLGLGLAVVTLVSKTILLPFDVVSLRQLIHWCLRLSLVVAADLAFVLALSSCCWLLAGWLARWPRAARLWRIAFLLLFEL